MNKLIYFILLIITPIIFSCGNKDPKTTKDGNVAEAPTLKGYELLDLSQWGFDMTLMVPNAKDNGDPNVKLTERGALEVSVGQNFGVEIMYGEGDINLLKEDLNEDLVFTSKIIKEDKDALVYQQEIPNSGVKTQYHFFYKTQIGADIYEVRDLRENEYGEGLINKMLDAAKTLQAVKPQPTT